MKRKNTILIFAITMLMLLFVTKPVPAQAAAPKLNKTSITLVKGKTYDLKVSNTSKKIKWKTKNKEVAYVYYTRDKNAKATIKAKATGTTTIVASVGKKKLTCKVKVIKAKLNQPYLYLYNGEHFQLAVTGAKVRKWKTSKPSVATVSTDGLVKCRKAGDVIISAVVGNSELVSKITVMTDKVPGDGLVNSGKPFYDDSLYYNKTEIAFESDKDLNKTKKALLKDEVIAGFYNQYIKGKNLTDVEKVQAIADFCWDNRFTYDHDDRYRGQSGYNLLHLKKAVCTGWAKATAYLCVVSDVPCYCVMLMGNHVKNIIKINNTWYCFEPQDMRYSTFRPVFGNSPLFDVYKYIGYKRYSDKREKIETKTVSFYKVFKDQYEIDDYYEAVETIKTTDALKGEYGKVYEGDLQIGSIIQYYGQRSYDEQHELPCYVGGDFGEFRNSKIYKY